MAERSDAYNTPVILADLYMRGNEKDEALKWLERAYKEHAAGPTMLKVDPGWDGLRSDPRFQDIVRRMSFPE